MKRRRPTSAELGFFRERRIAEGLNQIEMAKVLGIALHQVQSLERSKPVQAETFAKSEALFGRAPDSPSPVNPPAPIVLHDEAPMPEIVQAPVRTVGPPMGTTTEVGFVIGATQASIHARSLDQVLELVRAIWTIEHT